MRQLLNLELLWDLTHTTWLIWHINLYQDVIPRLTVSCISQTEISGDNLVLLTDTSTHTGCVFHVLWGHSIDIMILYDSYNTLSRSLSLTHTHTKFWNLTECFILSGCFSSMRTHMHGWAKHAKISRGREAVLHVYLWPLERLLSNSDNAQESRYFKLFFLSLRHYVGCLSDA